MSAQGSGQEPLDPDTAHIVKRVRRLMLVAGATTLIAMAAVFGVIGYRIFKSGDSAARDAASANAPVAHETVALPRGARVIATGVSDGRIAVTVEVGGATEIRTFDLRTLQPAGRLILRMEP